MTLTERIAARRCRFADCERERHPDMPVCTADLPEYWANRYDVRADGALLRRRLFVARDESGWRAAA